MKQRAEFTGKTVRFGNAGDSRAALNNHRKALDLVEELAKGIAWRSRAEKLDGPPVNFDWRRSVPCRKGVTGSSPLSTSDQNL